MAWVKVGPVAALPPGSVSEISVGENTYALCNADGEVYAISGVCPHANGPLGYGTLDGHVVICPLHAWEFDCRTGEELYRYDCRVPTFPAKVEDGQILIEVP